MSVSGELGTRSTTGPGAPTVTIPPAQDPGVDHVWANVRIFLPPRMFSAACQLGGDGLGPHLAGFASSAITVAPDAHEGPGWTALALPADAARFPDGAFDLVAIQDLARTGRQGADVLREAIRLCAPAGTVIVGYRPMRQGFAARVTIARRPHEVMAALPGVRRPAFLVDPRDRRAAGYFVRRMAFAYRTPGSKGIAAQARSVANGAARAVPARVALRASPARIAALPAAEAPTPLIERVQELVRASWASFGMPGPVPRRLEPLVVGHRRPATGIVTVLLFPSRGRAPIVAKLPRYGATDPALQREDRALSRAADAVTAPVRAEIPRSLGIHRVEDVDVLLQTGISGHHLVARVATGTLGRRRTEEHLDLVLAWCRRLQAASATDRLVDDDLIASRLEPLAAAAVAAMGGDHQVAAFLDRSLEDARKLRGTTLPMVVAHGDYWAGNILVARGRVSGVVDWERATVDDLPIWDPVKAVGSMAYHLDRYRSVPRRRRGGLPGWGALGSWEGVATPRFATGFRSAFVQQEWLAEVARDSLVRCFTRSQIPLGWLPVAVTFYLVRQIVQAGDAPRSVAGWGSVLQAMASDPGCWADAYAGERGATEPDAPTPDGRTEP